MRIISKGFERRNETFNSLKNKEEVVNPWYFWEEEMPHSRLDQSSLVPSTQQVAKKSPDFATSFFEKCGLSQYSCGPRENIAIILYDYISERLDG